MTSSSELHEVTWGDIAVPRKQEVGSPGRVLSVATRGQGVRHNTSPKVGKTPMHRVQEDELVFLRQGAAAGCLGVVPSGGGWLSVNFVPLSLTGIALPAFVRLLLQSEHVQHTFTQASYGTAQPFLSEKRFAAVPVSIPGWRQQERIVDLMLAIDRHVSALQQVVIAASRARLSLLRDHLSACPASHRLGAVAEVKYGKGLDRERRSSRGEYPYVTSAGAFAFSDEPLFTEDLVVVGRKGTLGHADVYRGGCWPSDTTFAVLPGEKVSAGYLALALEAADLASRQTTTTVPSLSRAALETCEVPIPTVDEQNAVVELVESATAALRASEASCVAARHLRSQILHDLLSGAHHIPESYDNLAR